MNESTKRNDEDDDDYKSPYLENDADYALAMDVLKLLHGLTPGQVKQVLRAAECMVDSLCVLDIKKLEFARADAIWHRVAGLSPSTDGHGASRLCPSCERRIDDR
uniref:Uncharacterized protein n=1 Tax=Candidatus Kentrum sp. LFY TaxID=2126342 RepID=A0A450WGW5_9GAMM|nr:MAG: hypothetical protein BECKLFY1418C_GA0070996_102224 [Candidatus Kentron sp. LFY]